MESADPAVSQTDIGIGGSTEDSWKNGVTPFGALTNIVVGGGDGQRNGPNDKTCTGCPPWSKDHNFTAGMWPFAIYE